MPHAHIWLLADLDPPQDELLGLEQQDETWAGIDPSVLFAFSEDSQVRSCLLHASWLVTEALSAQGHGTCYPRCLMVDSSAGLGGGLVSLHTDSYAHADQPLRVCRPCPAGP